MFTGLILPRQARCDDVTPGYPEAVVQWGVQRGETCDDIAKALYGSSEHVGLVTRYNHVNCASPLTVGATLVLPARVTALPDARVRGLHPDVRARPPGGAWASATAGMPLSSNAAVNTREEGRADIEFVDRTRIFLAPNTLVVIYATAGQSRVSKGPAASVEVDTGEVKAGLAALRGDGSGVSVGVKGGGLVRAASRETLVQRKGERTTVSVYDGKARVTSGGRGVDVATNFGTRFTGAAPPSTPRPLPPPPEWAAGESLFLADGDTGTVRGSWRAVPGAIAYRVEIARDEGFRDLIVREEVPAKILSYRAEKMPPGAYYVHVRAIDAEEYLGVAAARTVHLVAVNAGAGGAVDQTRILVNPYGTLRFPQTRAIEVAFDAGPFGPSPALVDVRSLRPKTLRLRVAGSEEVSSVAIAYTEVKPKIAVTWDSNASALLVRVDVIGADDTEARRRLGARVRAHLPGGVREEVLVLDARGSGVVSFPCEQVDSARVDVIDSGGDLLGSTEAELRSPPAPLKAEPTLGADAPPWPASPLVDAQWTAPMAPNVVVLSAAGTARRGFEAQGSARASGHVGPVSLDAGIRTKASGDEASGDSSAWFGVRARVLHLENRAFSLAPVFRVGLPASAGSPPVRIEPSIAVGGESGRLTWVVDAGARVRLREDTVSGSPPWQVFFLGGATHDIAPWARSYLVLDAPLARLDTANLAFHGGLSAGIEIGTALFGGLVLRATPWPDRETGYVTGQLSLGVREWAP